MDGKNGRHKKATFLLIFLYPLFPNRYNSVHDSTLMNDDKARAREIKSKNIFSNACFAGTLTADCPIATDGEGGDKS
jgi:hypothetical protein